MSNKIYLFGGNKTEGDATQKDILGGKGANLAEMSNIGIPVPPGFTISTKECHAFYENSKQLTQGLLDGLDSAIAHIQDVVGNGIGFGNAQNPLLVSVRSGAPVSMPGMMDTILNLGLNDSVVEGLAKKANNRRFALDCYRRFIQMYSNVVLDLDHHHFEAELKKLKTATKIEIDADLTEKHLEELIVSYKNIVKHDTGKDFPQDVKDQLIQAITAVFRSWMNPRAIYFRKINNFSESLGTAVNVQAMVFGNLGDTSATGVAFTRNPSDGDSALYGEYLINAQGEDVVAGIRTPYSINLKGKTEENKMYPSLEEAMPSVYQQFVDLYQKLEAHYKDMQDIEFTIQDEKLWILQTRSGKRTAKAAIKMAVDMANEGLISKETAIKRIDPSSLDQLLHKSLDKSKKYEILTKGLPASPGAASGCVALSSEKVVEYAANGKKVILVRAETSPEDIEGMNMSEGILTSLGGMTSHAAVVARGMGKTCITGAKEVNISGGVLKINHHTFKEGDIITIDGSTGEVYAGKLPTKDPELSEEFQTLMTWADATRKLKVRANAETPHDAAVAKKFGAEGIGLCRTEHMFFSKDRILNVRKMILATDKQGREIALAKLLDNQKEDFVQLFEVMAGLPVNIRLLDPPLHEFLPTRKEEIAEIASDLELSVDTIEFRVKSLHEHNPMLGHRGSRLGITYPEIYEMQVRAIFLATLEVQAKMAEAPKLEIMLPLIIDVKEFDILKDMVLLVAKDYPELPKFEIGTMIEMPRAVVVAGEIAQSAQYFSFGTNDLTQTTLGISRDDAANFLGHYQKAGILPHEPFSSIDVKGVGALVKQAVDAGRKARPGIKCGVCGEHGGDPKSIKFFIEIGMDYVSCSPYRVPIARLAAAIEGMK